MLMFLRKNQRLAQGIYGYRSGHRLKQKQVCQRFRFPPPDFKSATNAVAFYRQTALSKKSRSGERRWKKNRRNWSFLFLSESQIKE